VSNLNKRQGQDRESEDLAIQIKRDYATRREVLHSYFAGGTSPNRTDYGDFTRDFVS